MLDTLPREDLLSGCSSLLLVHGIGAMLGPMIAGELMSRHGPGALPAYFAAVLAALSLFLMARLALNRRPDRHPAAFHPMLRTTPAALELLPETESPPPTATQENP